MEKKARIWSALILLVGLSTLAYHYRAPIRKYLLKSFKREAAHWHQSEQYLGKNEKRFCWGIDISHHQRTIDWELLVEKNKPDFVFLKTTEGSTHVDTKYSTYLKKLRGFKIRVGAYHFFSYQSSGKSQAKNFIKNAKLTKGDLHPVLDVEFRNRMNSPTWIRREIKSFCTEIKNEYGVYPIIYCECAYYHKYLKRDLANLNFWISDLWREPTCDYVIWQYTDKGWVHGIGAIDNNRFHEDKKISDFLISKSSF